MHLAEGHAALRAARRLLLCHGGDVGAGDFKKVQRSVTGAALGRIGLGPVGEFEHFRIGHDAPAFRKVALGGDSAAVTQIRAFTTEFLSYLSPVQTI
jgi:hypothetical protein